MNYDDFGAPLPDGLEDRRHYAPGCYPYRNAEERDRYIAQMTTEYAHLPQIDVRSDFFLLPPASKIAQEIGAKPLRSSFHSDPRITGKRFAAANGFARTEAFSSCQNTSGKACSGKPSLFEEERAAKDCDCRRSITSIQHITKLLVALVETVSVMRDAPLHKRAEVVELTQELKQLMGQK